MAPGVDRCSTEAAGRLESVPLRPPPTSAAAPGPPGGAGARRAFLGAATGLAVLTATVLLLAGAASDAAGSRGGGATARAAATPGQCAVSGSGDPAVYAVLSALGLPWQDTENDMHAGATWTVRMATTDGDTTGFQPGANYSPSEIESVKVEVTAGGGPFLIAMVDLDPPEPVRSSTRGCESSRRSVLSPAHRCVDQGNPIWSQFLHWMVRFIRALTFCSAVAGSRLPPPVPSLRRSRCPVSTIRAVRRSRTSRAATD